MAVKARMLVGLIETLPNGTKRVKMFAVYSSDPEDPNYTYSQATPAATLEMYINNPEAADQFRSGDTVDLTFEVIKRLEQQNNG